MSFSVKDHGDGTLRADTFHQQQLLRPLLVLETPETRLRFPKAPVGYSPQRDYLCTHSCPHRGLSAVRNGTTCILLCQAEPPMFSSTGEKSLQQQKPPPDSLQVVAVCSRLSNKPSNHLTAPHHAWKMLFGFCISSSSSSHQLWSTGWRPQVRSLPCWKPAHLLQLRSKAGWDGALIFRLCEGRTTALTFILTRLLGDVTGFSVLRLQRAAVAVSSIWPQAPNAQFLYGEPTQHVLYIPLSSPATQTSTTNHRLFLYWGGPERVFFFLDKHYHFAGVFW